MMAELSRRHSMTRIEGELRGFRREIVRMGSLVTDCVMHAAEAVARADGHMARAVLRSDDEIDDLRFELDDRLVQTLALSHPLGQDLREVVAAMRICLALERIADHAVDVAKAMLKLLECEDYSQLLHPEIPEMGEICVDMLEKSMSAYFAREIDEAREISKRDDDVDARNRTVEQSYMSESKNRVPNAICAQNIIISRSFERIGDYVTNICEQILYETTGVQAEIN